MEVIVFIFNCIKEFFNELYNHPFIFAGVSFGSFLIAWFILDMLFDLIIGVLAPSRKDIRDFVSSRGNNLMNEEYMRSRQYLEYMNRKRR